jgi:hypothetical protein
MTKPNDVDSAPVHAVVHIRCDGNDNFTFRPKRGVIRLQNGISIDFGPGTTHLTDVAMELVNSSIRNLSLLTRST